MAGANFWGNNICPECGKIVEILNNDIKFSMDLHLQSHKSLDTIDQEIEEQMKNIRLGSKGSKKGDYTCPDCKEIVVIVNNDVSLSLQLHTQKHNAKKSQVDRKPVDQSSVSSGKSNNSDKKIKIKNNCKIELETPVSVFDGIFESMAAGLKLHKGFVTETKKGKYICNVCEIKIDSVFSISEHLKTKSHEDKIIVFFTNMLPIDSQHIMEFVSFYGSNLCCNLCRAKIDLCSNNPHETLVYILLHNSSKSHLKHRSTSKSSDDTYTKVIESLAKVNPVMDQNKIHIEYKMQPNFKCKLCDKAIAYEENDNVLFKNFVAHFSSKGHIKSVEAYTVVQQINVVVFPGKENHHLTALKGNVYCTICCCSIEVNPTQIVDHIRKLPPERNVSGTNSGSATGTKANNLTGIIKSLPGNLKKTNCIVENEKGQAKCLICNTILPASVYNIQTHLLGKSHKSKMESKNSTNVPPTKSSQRLTENTLILKNLFEALPVPLRHNFKYMEVVSKETVSCSICNVNVSAHASCLEEHLTGAAHKKSLNSKTLPQQEKNIFEKLIQNNPVIKDYAKHLTLEKGHFTCNICGNKIVLSKEVHVMKTNLLGHFNSKKHKSSLNKPLFEALTKLESTYPVFKSDKHFLKIEQNGICCTVCSCHLAITLDFANFKADNLVQHLLGNQHVGNKAKRVPATKPTTTNENNPQPINNRNFNLHSSNVQEDMTFFTSSPLEGYVKCTICNVLVNPSYIKEHLGDVCHIQKKSVFLLSTPSGSSFDGEAVSRNMGTLISLLGNIDKKIQWPLNN